MNKFKQAKSIVLNNQRRANKKIHSQIKLFPKISINYKVYKIIN